MQVEEKFREGFRQAERDIPRVLAVIESLLTELNSRANHEERKEGSAQK